MVIDDLVKCGECENTFERGHIVIFDPDTKYVFHANWKEAERDQPLPSDPSCFDRHKGENSSTQVKEGMYWLNGLVIDRPNKNELDPNKEKAEYLRVTNGHGAQFHIFMEEAISYVTSALQRPHVNSGWGTIYDFNKDPGPYHP